MAQLEGSEFDFSDLFVSPAISPSGMFGVVPGYDPSASDFFGPNVQRFIEILKGYFEDQDQDDIDRILRQGQVQKFIEVLRRFESGDATLKDLQQVDVSGLMDVEGFEDYYKDVTVVQAPQTWEGIEKILRDNGYSSGEIESVRNSVRCLIPTYSIENGKNVLDGYKIACSESEQFQGSSQVATILRDLGYEGGDWWDIRPSKQDGNSCLTTNESGNVATGTVVNGRCVVDGDDDGDGTEDADCTIITQENADECGYEITSDGQLVPKDLGKDPETYPTYVSCGGGIFAKTEEDCPDMEGTGGYSEEQKNIGKQITDWIEGQIGKIQDLTVDDVLETVFGGNDWDPLCKDEPGDIWDCNGKDGTTGKKCWKDCVSVSVLGGIPGLPMPPGNIDIGTVRDLEDKVKEIGGTISDIFSAPQGDADDEGFIQRTKDWVLGKIDDIFGNIDDVTPGQITDWITGVLGTTIAGVILKEIEGKKNSVIDKINEITGLPIATTDDENCKETEYFEANKDECTALGYVDCDTLTDEDGTELTGGIQKGQQNCSEVVDPNASTVDCKQGTKDADGNCICPNGEPEDEDGNCGDDSSVTSEEICKAKGLTHNPNDPTADSDGCVSTDVSDPACDDPNAQNYGEIGDCGECKANFKKDPKGTGKCVPSGNGGNGGGGGGNTTEVYKPDCKTDPRPTGLLTFDLQNKQRIWDRECGGKDGGGNSGSTTTDDKCKEINSSNYYECGKVDCFTDNTPGPFVDRFSDCPGSGGGYQCDDPNATVKEDGSCGPCKAGYVYDGAVEKCIQESVTNDCNDCTCAEYAAANPEECGTAPPPEPPSGGRVGGSPGGMFSVDAGFELSGDPQLLPQMQFPIENFLQQYVERMGDQNTSITSLFEGLV
jgi:hypothetical protein